MYSLISVVVISILLVVNELLWRNFKYREEYHRKIIHILVGVFVAFWPLYLSWNDIRVISIFFIIGVLVSKKIQVFGSLHSVDRTTFGMVFFALIIGLLTFMTNNDWLYAVAIMQMAIADGLAALIGTRFGANSSYRVFGVTKSLVGNLTCFASSMAIIFIGSAIGGVYIAWYIAVVTALVITITEGLAIFGLDNLLLPVITILLLRFW